MASQLIRSRASHEGEGVSRGQLCRANMGSARSLRSARLPLFETLEGRELMSAVTGFTLVNATSDRNLTTLRDGATINLATLPSRQLNVRASVSGRVESVRFGLDDVAAFRTDSSAPYALAGNKRKNYYAWTPGLGVHTLVATPYSRDRAAGAAGTRLVITFTVVDQAVPGAPSALTVLPLPSSSAVLSWADNAVNEDGFFVERAADGGAFARVAALRPNSTSYSELNLAPGGYSYRVCAFNAGGLSTASNTATVVLTPPPPAPPTGLTATSVPGGQVVLGWTDNSGDEQGFRIDRSLDGGVTFAVLASVAAGTTGYADDSVVSGTTYYYRVSAFSAAGDSGYSNAAVATTDPAPPNPVPAPTPEPVYSAPIVITRGGVYTGNWQSLDVNVPAVTIKTDEPVIIQGSNVRGRGVLIATATEHAHVTVQNTNGYALNPDVYGVTPGRFFEGTYFDSVLLQNNYLEGTGGIKLLEYRGDFTAAETVRVIGNRALNIDGRKSDGAGGYLDFNKRTRLSDGYGESGYKIRQFLQLDKVQGLAGVEIAWNQVVNEPGKSRVEDNINIYLSSGTADSPIRIHDNYIRGAYNLKPWQASYTDDTWDYDWGYSGGGILLGDGSSGVAYVKAYSNQVVSTSNYGIGIAAGHDMEFYGNRVISSGFLADGRWVYKQNVGVYIWDLYAVGATGFYNNSAHDNRVGWVKKPEGTRNDWWVPDATTFDNNAHWEGAVTPQTETDEFALWQTKVAAAGIVLGPSSPLGS